MNEPRRPLEDEMQRALRDTALATVDDSAPVPPVPWTDNVVTPLRAGRRWLPPLLAAAAVVAVVTGLTVATALRGHGSPNATGPAATGSITPRPSPTHDRHATTTPPRDPRTVDFANATIDLPAWPASSPSPAQDCPSGRRTFHDGRAQVGKWAMVLNSHIAYGNIDGQPGDEAVLSLYCANAEANPQMLFAVHVEPDGSLTTLGGTINIAGTQLLVIDAQSVAMHGPTVTVTVTGPYLGPGHPATTSQTRGYQLRGGSFTQVSGPTSFADTAVGVYGDCTKPSVEPTSIVLTCADYGEILQALHWTSWTATSATATGTYRYNDCTPNCATGHFHDIADVSVTLSNMTSGANGQPVWSLVTISPTPPGWSTGRLPLPTRPI